MMPIEESDQKASVQRIKQEIDKLTDQQSQALQLAIYVGMSRDDARKI